MCEISVKNDLEITESLRLLLINYTKNIVLAVAIRSTSFQ